MDRGSLDEVLMDVLRVLAVVVGVEGVGEFNLLLVTPLDDADEIRKSTQKETDVETGKIN